MANPRVNPPKSFDEIAKETEQAVASCRRAVNAYLKQDQSRAMIDDPRIHAPEKFRNALKAMRTIKVDEIPAGIDMKKTLDNLEEVATASFQNLAGGHTGSMSTLKKGLEDFLKVSDPENLMSESEKRVAQTFLAEQQKKLNEIAIQDMQNLQKKAAEETTETIKKINFARDQEIVAKIQKLGMYRGNDVNEWWVPDWDHEVPPKDEASAALVMSSEDDRLKKFRETDAEVYKSSSSPYKIVYDHKTHSAYHANMMDPELAAKIGMWGGNRAIAEKNFVEGWKRTAEFLLLKNGAPLNLGLDPEGVKSMTQEKRKDYLRYLLEVAEHAHHKLGVEVKLDDFTRKQISILFGAPANRDNIGKRFDNLIALLDARDTEISRYTQPQVDANLRRIHHAGLQTEANQKAPLESAGYKPLLPRKLLSESTEELKQLDTKVDNNANADAKQAIQEVKKLEDNTRKLAAASNELNQRIQAAVRKKDPESLNGAEAKLLVTEMREAQKKLKEQLVSCRSLPGVNDTKQFNDVSKTITNFEHAQLMQLENNLDSVLKTPIDQRVQNCLASPEVKTTEVIGSAVDYFKASEAEIHTRIKRVERMEEVWKKAKEPSSGVASEEVNKLKAEMGKEFDKIQERTRSVMLNPQFQDPSLREAIKTDQFVSRVNEMQKQLINDGIIVQPAGPGPGIKSS